MDRKSESDIERMLEIVDEIVLTNHNLIRQMIAIHEDKTIEVDPIIENIGFEKLSKYYSDLREVIRTILDNNEEDISIDEMTNVIVESNDDNEMDEEDRVKIIISAIKDRIDNIYTSMNFIPNAQAKPGGSLEKVGYNALIGSVYKQIGIIRIEDRFETDFKRKKVSPLILGALINSLADSQKYAEAEKQCEKLRNAHFRKKDDKREYPEIDETVSEIEYLGLENRYMGKFDAATGFMNSKTSYARKFLKLYESGRLTEYSKIDQEEIDLNMRTRIEDYISFNRNLIRSIFKTTVEKHQIVKKPKPSSPKPQSGKKNQDRVARRKALIEAARRRRRDSGR